MLSFFLSLFRPAFCLRINEKSLPPVDSKCLEEGGLMRQSLYAVISRSTSYTFSRFRRDMDRFFRPHDCFWPVPEFVPRLQTG